MSTATRITMPLAIALLTLNTGVSRVSAGEPTEPRVASRSRTTVTDLAPRANTEAPAAEAPSSVEPAKRWVWLEKQGVWGYGYQIESGPNRGLWRIDPGSKRPPAPEAVEIASDPYRFTQILNRIRASVGLQPVAYDHDLSAWAAQNNAAQMSRGLGHHVNPNCYQNCAWNTPEADSTVNTWLNSPGHRENMLAPEITRVGIAFGPGPYWTMNAR
ncbi:MAG: CAP domain-containing protein [Isosphaeraceae bacterium]